MIKKEYENKAWEETNILDLFHNLFPNIETSQKGSRYLCLCPYHNDHHPSMAIEPEKHRIRCYACGRTYYTFGLLKQEKGLSYPEAIRYIYEEGIIPDVAIKDIYDFQNKEDDKLWERKQKQYDYIQRACDFYREQYLTDNDFAKGCRDYAECREDKTDGRWTKDICDIETLGYADASRHSFVEWAIRQGLDLETMYEIGVVGREKISESTYRYYDAFADRLMFPYRDERNRVISFTGRMLNYKKGDKQKFKNCSCEKGRNLIFTKESTPWGLNNMSEVRKARKAYLVEGPGDAMTLKGIGVLNVMASGGGQWTKGQLQRIKGFGSTMPLLCFIPDIDENTTDVDGATVGLGESFVIKAGKLAMSMGFRVSVKAIPPNEDGSKVDAGEYFKDNPDRWKDVKEEDFIIWYAGKYFDQSVTDDENIKAVKVVCSMLLELHDDDLSFMNFNRLKKKYPSKEIWSSAMRLAKGEQNSSRQKKYYEEYGLNLDAYRLLAKDGCLYSLKDNNDPKNKLTNFLPRPLYYIDSDKQPLRIVEVDNHKDEPCIIAFTQEELSKMDKCVTRLGLNGNYSLFANGEEYKLFRALIYDGLKNATMVNSIGWNECGDDGFYVWGNGVFANRKWIEADDFGIIEYCGKYYYIPSCSKVNDKTNDPMVQNMRMYQHTPDDTVNITDFFKMVDDVFGDNGIVTLTFAIATMFRDIIFETTSYFPLLFIFGPNMTGKTTLAKNAMRMFMNTNQMTNLGSSSFAGLSRMMSMLSNAPVLMNEYFDTVGLKKIDMIKGIFEGTGRLMSSEDNESFVQFNANCSLIITGQDLPDYDPAMFSRSLLVEQYKNVFDSKMSKRLEELKEYQNKGLTNITIDILSHRDGFKKRWRKSWYETMDKFNNDEKLKTIPQRVRECWAIMYAAVSCLKDCGAKIPINITRLNNICIDYIKRQTEMMKNSDEVAKFWDKVDRAHSKNLLKDKVAFRVEYVDTPFEVSRRRVKRQLTSKECNFRVLKVFVRNTVDAVESLARKDDKVISEASLKHYLENTPEYLGTTVQSTYFRMLDEHGRLATTEKESGEQVPLRKPTRPMVFNYDALCEKYNINLTDTEQPKPSDTPII